MVGGDSAPITKRLSAESKMDAAVSRSKRFRLIKERLKCNDETASKEESIGDIIRLRFRIWCRAATRHWSRFLYYLTGERLNKSTLDKGKGNSLPGCWNWGLRHASLEKSGLASSGAANDLTLVLLPLLLLRFLRYRTLRRSGFPLFGSLVICQILNDQKGWQWNLTRAESR